MTDGGGWITVFLARSHHEQPCLVCGGQTEPAVLENKRAQRQCLSPDCAGREWWVQLTRRHQ